ncbi:Lipoprotein YcfM part of a salvage pathway ofuncharacterised substrate [Salmonella enterica subsp. diarizonae]|nr:Lipoprotein YcfM part of a salvage pathway ofuncharacterised substrate [Salmonella enterica subsp. diarizonae]
MTKMHRYAAIAALAIFLSGCMAQREPAPVEEVKPAPEQPAQPPQPPVVRLYRRFPSNRGRSNIEDQTGQPAPKVRHYDWNGAMQRWSAKCCRLMA